MRFNKDLVTCIGVSRTIHNYFEKDDHPQFFFRFKDQKNGSEIEGKILKPAGYNENKTIELKSILSIEDGITLIIGYSHMAISTALEGNELKIFNL